MAFFHSPLPAPLSAGWITYLCNESESPEILKAACQLMGDCVVGDFGWEKEAGVLTQAVCPLPFSFFQ